VLGVAVGLAALVRGEGLLLALPVLAFWYRQVTMRAWVARAAVLGLAVRGRWAALDLLLGAAWVMALAAAHGTLGDLLAATTELEDARGAVAGAALGALVAVAATLIAPRRKDSAGTANPSHSVRRNAALP